VTTATAPRTRRAPLRRCDIRLAIVNRRFNRLLDKTGPDFDGLRTAAWSDEEVAEFQWLGRALKRLGDHSTALDPCRCAAVQP
jgi:hypothetical protein